MNQKVKKAIEIFKTAFPANIGTGRKFKPMLCERNANVIEFTEDGVLYATVNVRSGLAVLV